MCLLVGSSDVCHKWNWDYNHNSAPQFHFIKGTKQFSEEKGFILRDTEKEV